MRENRIDRNNQLPSLPIGMLDDAPCVFEIGNDKQKLALEKLRVTLEETHILEQGTQQQSSSVKWQAARIGRVTASHFGDVLLRRSLPNESFIYAMDATMREKLVTFTPPRGKSS